MAITPDQFKQATAILTEADSVRTAAAVIRERFAPLKALVLDAFDLRGEQPAWSGADRAIYLMSTDGHCWTVTHEPDHAAAFVLTQN